jgi:hypothetical protein
VWGVCVWVCVRAAAAAIARLHRMQSGWHRLQQPPLFNSGDKAAFCVPFQIAACPPSSVVCRRGGARGRASVSYFGREGQYEKPRAASWLLCALWVLCAASAASASCSVVGGLWGFGFRRAQGSGRALTPVHLVAPSRYARGNLVRACAPPPKFLGWGAGWLGCPAGHGILPSCWGDDGRRPAAPVGSSPAGSRPAGQQEVRLGMVGGGER